MLITEEDVKLRRVDAISGAGAMRAGAMRAGAVKVEMDERVDASNVADRLRDGRARESTSRDDSLEESIRAIKRYVG